MSAYEFIMVIVLKSHMNGIHPVNRKASIEKEKGSTRQRGREVERRGVEDQVKGMRELQFV